MITVAILIHEYGHYYWMGREGISKKKMLFIPLMGAVAITQEGWPNRGAESRIALAGPLIGLFSALIPLVCYLISPLPIFAASAVIICFINLFNLIPITILDGGRVWKSIFYSIHPKVGQIFTWLGIVALCALLIFDSGFLALVLLISFLFMNERLEERRKKEMGIPDLQRMNIKEMILCSVIYVATFLFLIVLMYWATYLLTSRISWPFLMEIIGYF